MKNHILYALLLAIAFACSPNQNTAEHQIAERKYTPHAHWTYEGEEGVENWWKLNDKFRQCAHGSHQSPIDLETYSTGIVKKTGELLQFNYLRSTVHVLNNGHTIEVKVDGENQLSLHEKSYRLLQFHFHAPSEHQMDGLIFPMEVHFVHQNSDGDFAVLGAFIKEGPHNSLLDSIWNHLPQEITPLEYSFSTDFQLEQFFPASPHFYHYEGSLTTPPCTEGVEWFLLSEPIAMSKAQIAAFRQLYNGNARPVQATNDRVVEEVVK